MKQSNFKYWILFWFTLTLVLGLILYEILTREKNEILPNSLANHNDFEMVNFNLVYGKTQMNYTRYYLKNYMEILSDKNFSFNRKTLFYIHGWIEDFESESCQTISNAYMRRGDHNIVIIDWGQYSFGEYYTVIPRLTQISKFLGMIFFEWIEKGLDSKNIHCVGHSFGSHMMGIMARELSRLSMGRYKIKRISGLDPAHYGFFPNPSQEKPLSKTDAEFVDVIHTDVNFIGTNYQIGHVDFFPNKGNVQPGCPQFKFKNYMDLVNSFCSHQHGWRYWAETVKLDKERSFPAVLCNNYYDFTDGKCNENPINFMGFGAMSSIPGTFFNKLRSNVNFTVDNTYYLYLATSLNYRSDLSRIVSKLWKFFDALNEK